MLNQNIMSNIKSKREWLPHLSDAALNALIGGFRRCYCVHKDEEYIDDWSPCDRKVIEAILNSKHRRKYQRKHSPVRDNKEVENPSHVKLFSPLSLLNFYFLEWSVGWPREMTVLVFTYLEPKEAFSRPCTALEHLYEKVKNVKSQ